MPDHRTHHAIAKLLLGKAYPDVDAWMDEPYKWLGARHRILRHNALTTPSVVFMRELLKSGDAEKALKKAAAALIHIAADKLL